LRGDLDGCVLCYRPCSARVIQISAVSIAALKISGRPAITLLWRKPDSCKRVTRQRVLRHRLAGLNVTTRAALQKTWRVFFQVRQAAGGTNHPFSLVANCQLTIESSYLKRLVDEQDANPPHPFLMNCHTSHEYTFESTPSCRPPEKGTARRLHIDFVAWFRRS
jgi:hypothetical protein